LRLFDAANGDMLELHEGGHSGPIRTLRASPPSCAKSLALSCSSTEVHLWDVSAMDHGAAHVFEAGLHKMTPVDLYFDRLRSSGGFCPNLPYSLNAPGFIQPLHVRSENLVSKFAFKFNLYRYIEGSCNAAFGHAAKQMVVVGEDLVGTMRLVDCSTGALVQTFTPTPLRPLGAGEGGAGGAMPRLHFSMVEAVQGENLVETHRLIAPGFNPYAYQVKTLFQNLLFQI
jgi:hypothetical protein